MDHPDYNSPQALKDFLQERGMAMQKKFGQNFLVNKEARKNIVNLLDIKEGDSVWEIGPGLGCMTEEILSRGANLTVFEIDRGFAECIRSFFSDYESKGKFHVVQGDVLKTWKKELKKNSSGAGSIKLFGNLPYNIAATFVADTITENVSFERCVFTVQKEVAQRMAAKNSSEDYSSFSVLCQWAYNVKTNAVLAPGNFWPRPNVDSQTVVFSKREPPLVCTSPSDFVKVVHTLFSNRRKTILNNAKKILPPNLSPEDFCAAAGTSTKERAENLTVEQFLLLSEKLHSAILENHE